MEEHHIRVGLMPAKDYTWLIVNLVVGACVLICFGTCLFYWRRAKKLDEAKSVSVVAAENSYG